MTEAHIYVRITVEELRRKMEENRDFVLLDTLTRSHYEKVHLPGAKSACVFEVTFLEQVKALVTGTETDIVVYGFSSKTWDAGAAADKLVRAGFKNVSALRGGIEYWRKAGYPLEGAIPEHVPAPEPAVDLADGIYAVDPENSFLEWAGRNPNSKHHGTVRIRKGTVSVSEGKITGSFEIDMNSIENINLAGHELYPVLIAHLKSDDFFFTESFPIAKYTIESASPVKDPAKGLPNYDVNGELELRGKKAGLDFSATVSPLEEGGVAAEAHFDIDRTRWGVIYGSGRFFEHLGMHLVFDPISIQVRIVARPV